MKHGSLGIFCGSNSSTHPATHSFISLASMLPLPSLSYIRNIRRNFSSGLPLEVMWITLRAIIWTKSKPEGKNTLTKNLYERTQRRIPWQSRGNRWCSHSCWKLRKPSNGGLELHQLKRPDQNILSSKKQRKKPGNFYTLVFETSTHCHTFEYSLEKSSGVICPLGHSFWKAV